MVDNASFEGYSALISFAEKLYIGIHIFKKFFKNLTTRDFYPGLFVASILSLFGWRGLDGRGHL